MVFRLFCLVVCVVVLCLCFESCRGTQQSDNAEQINHNIKRAVEHVQRIRRAVVTITTLPVASPDNQFCGQWSDWISTARPMLPLLNTEEDLVSASAMGSFCPVTVGGVIDDIRCGDDKGEPHREGYDMYSGDRKYQYSCGNFGNDMGVKCTVIDVNSTCPDHSFKLHCDCDPARISTTLASPSTTETESTTSSASTSATTTPTSTSTTTSTTSPSSTSTVPIVTTRHNSETSSGQVVPCPDQNVDSKGPSIGESLLGGLMSGDSLFDGEGGNVVQQKVAGNLTLSWWKTIAGRLAPN